MLAPPHEQLAHGASAVDEVFIDDTDDGHPASTSARSARNDGALEACVWKVHTDDERRPLLLRARLPLTRLRALAHDRAGDASSASLLLGESDVSLLRASAPQAANGRVGT
mgnify:CR=1 FL=1